MPRQACNNKVHYRYIIAIDLCTVAEEYNGFRACFSKFTGENFDCDCNAQLSTMIHLFNSDLFFNFQHAIAIFNVQLRFQLSTAIQFFNFHATLNRDSTFQRSTAIATFRTMIWFFNFHSNFQPRLAFSASVILTVVYWGEPERAPH